MIYFEDVDVGDVSEYGHYEVTAEEIKAFAERYDPQPFHLDEDAAAKSLFGTLCASGWHTCAMTMRMIIDNAREQKIQGFGSPGVDEIRWLKPVTPGMVLSIRSEVTSLKPSRSRPNIGLVTNAMVVKDQEGTDVMTMTASMFILRRQPGAV